MQKKLVNKLAEECVENIEEIKIAKLIPAENENKHRCSSSTPYIVLFSLIFTTNIGIGSYFLYFYWYSKKDVTRVKFGSRTKTKI